MNIYQFGSALFIIVKKIEDQIDYKELALDIWNKKKWFPCEKDKNQI